MQRNNTIFDFLTQTMVIWGVSVLSLCLFCFLFGKDARGVSTIFEMGNQGISIATLVQFLGLAFLIGLFRLLFFTTMVIKRGSIVVRVIGMFASVIITIAVFAGIFKWFPINQMMPWVMFFACFVICGACSVIVSVLKEKSDNKKMQDALERLKGEEC